MPRAHARARHAFLFLFLLLYVAGSAAFTDGRECAHGCELFRQRNTTTTIQRDDDADDAPTRYATPVRLHPIDDCGPMRSSSSTSRFDAAARHDADPLLLLLSF